MALAGQQNLSGQEEANRKYSAILSQIPKLLTHFEEYIPSTNSSNDVIVNSNPSSSYVSCIKINGMPILPPILDEAAREEMRGYRDEAIKRVQQRKQSKQRTTDSSASINNSPVVENSSNLLQDQIRTASVQDNIPEYIIDQNKSSESQRSLFAEEKPVPEVLFDLVPTESEVTIQENRDETSLISPTSKLNYYDSLLMTSSHSNLSSLEECSLPTEMNGIPLTSRCEQQITKDLSTLIKHFPDNCSSDSSDFSDAHSHLNFDLICDSSDQNKENSTKPEICSFLSNTKSKKSDSPVHSSNNKSQILKAPIFLTNENGLELHALPPHTNLMNANVTKAQGWIMNSPLIAYVTKKRPKTVGMSSKSPQKPIKMQQIGNATFTLDPKAGENEDELIRPIIPDSQVSPVANVCQFNSSNNSVSPKTKLREFSKLKQSYNNNNNSLEANLSNQEQIFNHPNTNPILPACLKVSNNFSKGNNSTIDTSLLESKSEDIDHKMSSSSSSPHVLSIKDHMSDDSLDDLLFGIDKVGFVPRKDGDGSELKDLNNPVRIGAVNKKYSQQSVKTKVFSPPELIQADFIPLRTLQTSTATAAMTDIPISLDVSTSDSTANHLILPEENMSTTSSSDITSVCKYSSDPVNRRGSYTLMEPSVDLRKCFSHILHYSHENNNDDDSNSNCSVSDKIPTYEDFETQLHKKNSENISPLPIRTDMNSFKSEQSSDKIEVKSPTTNSVKYSSPVTKEKISRMSILETSPASAASGHGDCSTLNASRKRSRIMNKDKYNFNNSSTSYHPQNGLEALTFKDSIHSSNSPGQSAVLTSNELFNWEEMIGDEMKLFFSEKRQSFVKMQQQFKEYEEQFEEEYQRTLDSMQKSQHWPKDWTSEFDTLIPNVYMACSGIGNPTLLNNQKISTPSQTKSHQLVKTKQNPACVITAAVKGYLTRKLLSCPKVESLRKTIDECVKLLEETIDTSNLDLVTRLNNQLDAARLDIYDIFFEMTPQDRMNIIHQSRLLATKKPQAKPQQISSATQKYLMRKNQITQVQKQSPSSSLSDKSNSRNNAKLHPIPSLVQPTKSTRKISSQQFPKSKIVSVAGKMAATRFVSTRMKDLPSLKITSSKPWR